MITRRTTGGIGRRDAEMGGGEDRLPLLRASPREQQDAARYVAASARDATDLAMLLDALGIDPDDLTRRSERDAA